MTILKSFLEMYAELALVKLLVSDDDIELPQAVSEEREIQRKKMLVKELEVCLTR